MSIPVSQFIPPPPLIPGNHSLYSTSVTLFLLTNILKPVVRFNEKVLKANEQKMYLAVVWNRNQQRPNAYLNFKVLDPLVPVMTLTGSREMEVGPR